MFGLPGRIVTSPHPYVYCLIDVEVTSLVIAAPAPAQSPPPVKEPPIPPLAISTLPGIAPELLLLLTPLTDIK
jgi:hypothetical protein